jgi:aspartyl-tRNA(Asn)/glutamyl-tRNA(Gln) amidotransferase subunit A
MLHGWIIEDGMLFECRGRLGGEGRGPGSSGFTVLQCDSHSAMPAATDTDLAFASIFQVARLFRKRKLSPVELIRILLARIDQLNPQLNAFLTVTPDLALAQAKQAERELSRGKSSRDRGPLHGIPISLKDNINTAGMRTTGGSKILKDFIPQRDATLASQLKQAGAVLLGKNSLHEFAYGITSNNPHFGAVHNPWNLSRIPGGSSGGSAAAVAAGLCYGSIGTDTGGSIRIPASLCGVVGLKPTLGRVSVDGVIPLSRKLDCAGPLARTVHDVALLLEPILARVKGEPAPGTIGKSSAKARKFTLGIPKEFFLEVVSEDVYFVFDEALRILKKQGVKFREVALPLLKETEDAGNQIAWAEATHYHQQAGWFPSRLADYGDDVRSRLEMGIKVSATTYLSALELREKFIQQFHLALEDAKVDALVYPSTPITAPQIGLESIRISNTAERSRVPRGNGSPAASGSEHSMRALLLRNNRPANLAGVPAISIPSGFTPDNLPVGLQFLGAVADEHLLLELGLLYERACPQSRRPPLASA